LLSGRTPFTGRTFEEIRARQSEEPPLDQLKDAKASAPVIGLARIALDQAVELQPGYADAWAALAIVVIDEDRHAFNSRPDSLYRAERAFDIDPASLMANYALAETQYFCGDLGAFRAAAERALALNSRCSSYFGDKTLGLRLTSKDRAASLATARGSYCHRRLEGDRRGNCKGAFRGGRLRGGELCVEQ
jgi:hypothetical protein